VTTLTYNTSTSRCIPSTSWRAPGHRLINEHQHLRCEAAACYRVPTVSVNGGCSTTDDYVCCPDNIKIEKLKKDDCTPAT
ncbi:hypothetical protein PSTT_07165, partial [Puccinia striiformis]